MRATDWTEEQDALLRAMYPANPMPEIVESTGRTVHAVYARAKVLKLSRESKTKFGKGQKGGKGFAPGNVPWNAGKTVFKATHPHDKVLHEFRNHQEQTARSLSEATGMRKSACAAVCRNMVKKGEAHVVRWEVVKTSKWNKVAVYGFGPGENAPRPPSKASLANESNPFEVLPIPTPPIGLWGLCWPNITTPAQPAERNTAP
jgi:hypothetical protein